MVVCFLLLLSISSNFFQFIPTLGCKFDELLHCRFVRIFIINDVLITNLWLSTTGKKSKKNEMNFVFCAPMVLPHQPLACPCSQKAEGRPFWHSVCIVPLCAFVPFFFLVNPKKKFQMLCFWLWRLCGNCLCGRVEHLVTEVPCLAATHTFALFALDVAQHCYR